MEYNPFRTQASTSEMRRDRNQRRKNLNRGQLSKSRRDDAEEHLNITIERTKDHGGQTLLVAFHHCGDSEPIARWWSVSRQLVFVSGETVYGVDSERDALRQVTVRL